MIRKIIAAMAVAVMCFAFAGCGGGGSGYGEGEQFQLGDETYALEKVVRATDKDTGSTECYGVSLLQKGQTAPVIISGFGTGAATTQSALEMTLVDGDNTYAAKSVSFAAIDDVEGYGLRMIFYFDIPAGTELPASATLKRSDSDEEVQLDLSGLKTEEETTTTTTTTAPISTAPDAGNENYDGIGNTDVYDGIGDTDIFNADDTIQDDIVQPGL